MIIFCVRCGVEAQTTVRLRKYCDECAKLTQREAQRNLRRKQRGTPDSRVCIDCGATIPPQKLKRCDECAKSGYAERNRQAANRWYHEHAEHVAEMHQANRPRYNRYNRDYHNRHKNTPTASE